MENSLDKLQLESQDVIIEILKDSIDDNKHIIRRLQATIVLLVCLLVGTFIYYEWSFKAFMSQYDYENTITTTTNADSKAYDKNNTINTNISDIKVNGIK